jgi:hypothetical protein
MKMVAHHGIAEHLDAHDSGEKLQPLANQFPALIVVFAGDFVVATEKRATDTAIDSVDNLNFLIRQNIPPIRSRHRKNSTRHPMLFQESKTLAKQYQDLYKLSNDRWMAPPNVQERGLVASA